MRALVVDDSSAMRAVLSMTLKRRGFEILQAKDGIRSAHRVVGRAERLI